MVKREVPLVFIFIKPSNESKHKQGNSNRDTVWIEPFFIMKHFHSLSHWRTPRREGKGGKSNHVDEENVTLRIHRGNKNQRSDFPFSNSTTNLEGLRKNRASVTSMPSFERKKRNGSKYKEKVKISISYPSTEHIASPTMSTTSSNQASIISSSCSKEPIALRHSSSNECHSIFKDANARNGNSLNNSHKKAGKRTSSGVKVQVRKFRMETKAAKTLAIIVGKCLKW